MGMGEFAGKYGILAIVALLLITALTSVSLVKATSIEHQGIIVVERGFSLKLSELKYVSGPSGKYLVAPGLKLTIIPGKPVLPVKVMEFELPHNSRVLNVRMDGVEYGFYPSKVYISPGKLPVLKGNRNLPALISLEKIIHSTYSSHSYYPSKPYYYRIGRTNENTIVRVYIYPVQYNPGLQRARILASAKIIVEYSLLKQRNRVPPINVPNIIITSPELKQQAQRLADFHNSTGITSWVVTTDWIANNYGPAEKPPFKGYGDSYTDEYHNIYFRGKLPLRHDNIIGYNITLARKIVSFLRDEIGGSVEYVTIFGNARMVPPSYYWVDQYMYLWAYLYSLFGYPSDYYDAWIPTDAFYASPDYNSTSFDFTPNFKVGRIPVNPFTAEKVVDKIIYYGTHKSWGIRNITLSGGQVFETPYFLGETAEIEPLDYGWLNGLRVTEYFHTLRNYTFNNFIRMMKTSDMIIEVTHGSGFSFWHQNDEVSAWDFSMNSSYGSLPIYVSGSCLNGAWDEEVYPSYEMSYGINGGTSIAEKMIYAPSGAIAYIGADREAYGSTFAYFLNGTLVAPNDFGDLITEDGTTYGYYRAMKDNGEVYLGDLGYWAQYVYQSWVMALDNVSLSAVDPLNSGFNDNPWARSYFEYSLLGDPALKIASRSTTPTNYYNTPQLEVAYAHYNSAGIPTVKRNTPVVVNITTNSTYVKVQLIYIEHDMGYSPYTQENEETYYDFVMDNVTLPTIAGKTIYTFVPQREGIYIVSVYTQDGKNTRLYVSVEMPVAPSLKVRNENIFSEFNEFRKYGTRGIKVAQGVNVVTILDYGDVIVGKTTNATAVLYNNGDTGLSNVRVQFYLENYTLVFVDRDLDHPLINLGKVTVSYIPPHGYAYATIQWTAHDLHQENPAWDPHYSSARWQYFVTKAGNSENWALFRVHTAVDIWAQKVFIEKDPAYNNPNNVTVEITNVGYQTSSQTTLILKDKFGIISTRVISGIGPYQTVFLRIPWTPAGYGKDTLTLNTSSEGDINRMNDNSSYYSNAYYSVSEFKVLNYDLTPINITQKDMNLTVQVYNYGPNDAQSSTVSIYEIPGAKPIDVESPHPYPNNYEHTWTISVPGANAISLHFKYIEVEKDYDYLNISDVNHKVVASYTGFYRDIWSPLVKGSVVYVTLKSDVGVNYTGFYIDMYATEKPLYVVSVQFNSVKSGEYKNETIPINTTNHVVVGTCAFKLVVKDKNDVATLTTGGEDNNVVTIPSKIYETDNITSIPQISLLSPSDNSIVGSQVTVVLSLKDSIATTIYNGTVKIDGTVYHQQFSLQSDWTIKSVISFSSDGTHTISINVTDAANHNSNVVTFHLTSDTTPPKVTITAPSNNAIVNKREITLTWNIEEPHLDHISIPGYANDLPPSTTSYEINVSKDGKYNISVVAVDVVGNTGEGWVNVIVDTTPPSIDIKSPANNTVIGTTSVDVEWSVSDENLKSVELWVDNGTHIDVTGLTHQLLNLSSGSHKIYISAVDKAGNSRTEWISVNVEIEPFQIKAVSPESGSKISSTNMTITITFSKQAEISTLQYQVVGGTYNITITWENNNTVLVVKLTNLEWGKKYQFTIVSLKDIYGNDLQNAPYTYTFTVASKSSNNKSVGILSSEVLWILVGVVTVMIIASIAVWYIKRGKSDGEIKSEETGIEE